MASHNAHHSTGIAAGIIASVLVIKSDASGPYHVLAILALVAGIIGGTAPDWMEIAWWSRKHRLWITHRTWTHWGIAWIGLLIYSYLSISTESWAPILFGFSAGGVMHLLADWPNPLGVPWLIGRHSLKLWKSGRCDSIVIVAAWISAFVVSDGIFFENKYTHLIVEITRGASVKF